MGKRADKSRLAKKAPTANFGVCLLRVGSLQSKPLIELYMHHLMDRAHAATAKNAAKSIAVSDDLAHQRIGPRTIFSATPDWRIHCQAAIGSSNSPLQCSCQR